MPCLLLPEALCGRSFSRSLLVVLLCLGAVHASAPLPFVLASDVSYLPVIDCRGTCSPFRLTPSSPRSDGLEMMAAAGVNTVRLRVWVNPSAHTPNGWPTPDYTYANATSILAVARRVFQAGMRLWIDFHYSYVWADPSHQFKPAIWEKLSIEELREAVYNHTFAVTSALAAQGTPADIVQVGNEIANGMLWAADGQPCSTGGGLYGPGCSGEEGFGGAASGAHDKSRVWRHKSDHNKPSFTPKERAEATNTAATTGNWPVLASLVSAGVRAVRATSPSTAVMIHVHLGSDLNSSSAPADIIWWYQTLDEAGANDWDVAGLSFYPFWGAGYSTNVAKLSKFVEQFPTKKLFIAETALPYQDGQPGSEFPATPTGQRDFLCAMINQVRSLPQGAGWGVSWWGAEYYSESTGAGWTAHWDQQGVALPVLTQGYKKGCGAA